MTQATTGRKDKNIQANDSRGQKEQAIPTTKRAKHKHPKE
jgi:hypothetical protein